MMNGGVMARKKKTVAEWIAFGNRVKNVRTELMDLHSNCSGGVTSAPIMDELQRVISKLDRWKSRMEGFVLKTFPDLPDGLATSIFYGNPLPNGRWSADGALLANPINIKVCDLPPDAPSQEWIDAAAKLQIEQEDIESTKPTEDSFDA